VLILNPLKKIYFYKRKNSTRKDELSDRLKSLNKEMSQKSNENLNRAIDNSVAACWYHLFSYDELEYKKLSFLNTFFVRIYFHYPNGEFKHSDEIKQLIENDINFQTYVITQNGWVSGVSRGWPNRQLSTNPKYIAHGFFELVTII
jgi:hypothetical protein